jgi:hypothetical protein
VGAVRLAALLLVALGGCGDPPVVVSDVRDPGARKESAALAAFLERGPARGVWESKGLSHARTFVVVPHPSEEGRLLVAETKRGLTAGHALTRAEFARMLLDAPAALFFENYAPAGPAADATARDGTRARLVEWTPRREHLGETCRRAWFDAATGDAIQVEDRSYGGHVIRGIYRVDAEVREKPAFGEGPGQLSCAGGPPAGNDLDRVAREAPFTVVAPAYLPPGYRRVSAEFGKRRVACEDPGPPVPFASLLYSDGLGLLSVGIARRDDLDAIEKALASMPANPDDPDACPTLPPSTEPVVEGEVVVRWRTDQCRTVLRLDDFHGVSVAVLSRNEVPSDEYLKVVKSLAVVPKPPQEPVKDR